jgi:prepilin-type N-terminal cleavage/methylation domain-containing protein
MGKKGAGGLTLVELLVVIAIIAVLALLLLPLRGARAGAELEWGQNGLFILCANRILK